MAITHTETVSNLIVLNDGTDVVSQVVIKTVSVDDSDPSTLTQTVEENFPVDTSGGTGASGFVAYASLTQADILAWTPVADGLSRSNSEINQAAWIESVKNPPAPATVNEALPF